MTETSASVVPGAERALALDAMGGDYAPAEIVRGGVAFARESGRRVLLVGRREAIEPALAAAKAGDAPVEIVEASEVIGFEDHIAAVRSKRDSSLHVGARLVRDGKAAGFVSAGHTGAMMAICKTVLGVIRGVDRPALPAPLPRLDGGRVIIVDAGANLACKAEHLRQFAVMGSHYCRRVFGVPSPKVALLSVGEEDSKGTEVGREAAELLRASSLEFVGNIEGNSLLSGRADVVVCDGFVGNVALKVAEGVAETVGGMLRSELTRRPWRLPLAAWLRSVMRPQWRRLDYAEVGGVPLLGLARAAVVAHGRSSAKATANALRVCEAVVAGGMIEQIAGEFAAAAAAAGVGAPATGVAR